MDQASHVGSGAEEWLRRIAVDHSFTGVPDNVAVALLAIGFAARKADGSLSATEAGRTHLHACGIATDLRRERTSLPEDSVSDGL